jgi:putative peptidoglycan lipid II flippase|tara:strand:+ start:93092 stop:94648 length:1557 start_codon:yes stop_codon:yes gene_type:complete
VNKPPLKATLTVGGATFISRIFGYVRDAVIFILFGANAGTDAFFVAFRIPNFLRRIFAEGAFSQAFVPVMTSHLKQDKPSFRRLIDHSCGLLSLSLLFITALGMLSAPWLITLFAPGFNDPTQQQLASDMLRIVFPYLFFISLTAMAASLLNVKQRFAIPALTPVLLNVALILAAIFLAPRMAQPITALAWGVFIGGAAQLALQIPFLLKENCLPRPRLSGAKDGVKRIAKLMLPAIFGSSIVQLNLLINTIIASFLTVGSISWLYVSDRFVELPLALFGVAIATVLLPMLSRQFVAANDDDFNNSLHWALRLTCLFAIPATAGLILLAEPIIISLMQYRAFTALDTQMSAFSLIAYGSGLPAFIAIKILAPGFFARENTRTPMLIGVAAIAFNIALSLSLLWLWHQQQWLAAHAGLALATSLAGYLNAFLLYRGLRREQVLKRDTRYFSLLAKIILATLILSGLLVSILPEPSQWIESGVFIRVLLLTALIAVAVLAYAASLFLLGLRPAQFKYPAP